MLLYRSDCSPELGPLLGLLFLLLRARLFLTTRRFFLFLFFLFRSFSSLRFRSRASFSAFSFSSLSFSCASSVLIHGWLSLFVGKFARGLRALRPAKRALVSPTLARINSRLLLVALGARAAISLIPHAHAHTGLIEFLTVSSSQQNKTKNIERHTRTRIRTRQTNRQPARQTDRHRRKDECPECPRGRVLLRVFSSLL